MKELYSIGETAKLFGISVQTLRNYSNLKLLKPQYIDADSGYRYYSFQQFHYIDRIKYLRKLGLSLAEIEEILDDGKADKMLAYLEIQEKRIVDELKKIQEIHEDIKWYISYFKYLKQYAFDNIPYVLQLDRRYIMYVDYLPADTVESVETRLAKLKNSKKLSYRRQYGYIASFDNLVDKKFVPHKYFIYLKEKPDCVEDWYMELPAGEYLCFRGRIRTDDWDPSIIAAYFKAHKTPAYVIANEYEDNLAEYHYCPYEIQSLISD
jgi:Predicted transcriptional regulators